MDATHTPSDLYPASNSFASGMLDVGDGHKIYWEQSGNPEGPAVVFLHGGPGAGCWSHHRRYFDPEHYHAILFDQRGCGNSTPHGRIENNTTDHLIADMEQLREHLGVDEWFLFGGSWGSTLALAYGVHHPDRCLGFVLRGIFLGTPDELDWFMFGIATVFPEAHRTFTGFLPEDERDDLFNAYYRRLMDPDEAVHLPAAGAWTRYETSCSVFKPDPPAPPGKGTPHSMAMARLEAHYFKHDMFLGNTDIIGNLHRLADKPTVVVQGRYDMICPIRTADRLVRAWPSEADIRYYIIDDAGHAANEPGIQAMLVNAMNDFRSL
ncbi:MAG: prolyl aminopeptidase [Rhodospirillaceae bacterium]|jgi:proline iminopeptidase|nr:prolyl aminopeptidase [Rhodospirillaceae bacterium]MBT4220198.1 prolyl aminopeptidase [Rhodospirillaceae bacterium]MBT4463379.1 prolyl aminopeptidase [Rhodospirillaceae bacterium]MBT5014471.1 prolyl aminopeptidase [Rhodospirillaceae bacterium]MBT5307971.1 prolyl aminopeptidase [Rhodospirillaceae bacterium]